MGHRIGYNGNTRIYRREYGLTFSPVLDGRLVVSDEINIMIEGELLEQVAPVEEPPATAT